MGITEAPSASRVVIGVVVCISLLRWLRLFRAPATTSLRGPKGRLLFGLMREILGNDYMSLLEVWEKQYGSVFQVPTLLGSKDMVLCDPKAIAHHFLKDTYTYQQTPFNRFIFERFFGRNLLWAEADTHKRQRKALSAAFSNAAIRDHTAVFYDSAYKLKTSWEQQFQSTSSDDGVIIDVQQWMNRVSLDSIGIAGFSYEFETLSGRSSQVAAAFEAFSSSTRSIISDVALLIAPLFPWLLELPGPRKTALRNLSTVVGNIAVDILRKAKSEGEYISGGVADRSILGALIRSEAASRMSLEEIMAQHLLVLAGYETTAISLTWALIELSRNPRVQGKLREELLQYSDDPAWEELTNGLPYLNAVTYETLRLFAPGKETIRKAQEDDIIPLSRPMKDASNKDITSIYIAKGTNVRVPIAFINSSETLWGPNAKDFIPERWLDDSITQQRASEIQGHHHILTFADGPRMCLGKSFALSEFKAVLSVLVRNFTFELPGGPDTKFEVHKAILDRPKVAGHDKAETPLIVRRVE